MNRGKKKGRRAIRMCTNCGARNRGFGVLFRTKTLLLGSRMERRP